jgi:hypothetical protein
VRNNPSESRGRPVGGLARTARRHDREDAMNAFDGLGNLLRQATSGNAPEPEVHAAYDQVSRQVPQESLADGVAHAIRSDQTPPFEQWAARSYRSAAPEQKAGLLNQILGALGAGGIAQALRGLGGPAPESQALSRGNVTPQEAERIPPETVEQLAQHAQRQDPSIVDRASRFYAEHPQLVKTMGVGALAVLMSRLSASSRGRH